MRASTQSKETEPEVTTQAEPTAIPSRIGLDEYCSKLSTTGGRVETIGGFYFWCTNELKVTKTTEQEFETLYQRFKTMPV